MYQIDSTKFLDESEIEALRRVLEIRSTKERDRLLIEVALSTGARASEVLGIEVKDLNPTTKTVFIRGLKGSFNRELPLPTDLFDRLMAYITRPTEVGSSEKVFPIALRTFDHIWRIYRPVKKKLHSLRHTFAMRLYQKTGDIRLVQKTLGHKNINNTLVYAQKVYSIEEMREALCN